MKFIQQYGIISKSLTELLKKWVWMEFRVIYSLQQLKEAMEQAPALALLNFKQPFSIEIDACKDGIRALLMQEKANSFP